MDNSGNSTSLALSALQKKPEPAVLWVSGEASRTKIVKENLQSVSLISPNE